MTAFMDLVTKALGSSAAGRQLVAEARKAASEKRAAKCEELRRARAAAEARLVPLVEAEKEATAAVAPAREALIAAEGKVREAADARFSAAHQVEREVMAIEAELVELAPPEIGRFLDYVAAVAGAVQVMDEGWGPNRPARVRLLEVLGASRERAEELRRSGLADEEIIADLRRLRGEIEKGARNVDRGFPRDVTEARSFEVGPEAA